MLCKVLGELHLRFKSATLIKLRWFKVAAPLTQESTAGHLAGLGDAADHRRGHIHVQAPAGEVVEEKERLGTLSQHIIHTHGYQVLAKTAVLPARLSNLMDNKHTSKLSRKNRLKHGGGRGRITR